MIDRYSRPDMVGIWQPQSRFAFMLKVEVAVAQAQAANDIIPKQAAEDIAEKGKFDVARINEIEITTRHDVIAFVTNVAENVGENGRWVHYGLTSSDVLDTATSLQVEAAYQLLGKTLSQFLTQLSSTAKKHSAVLCAGRTHGMHAEPTGFGLKLAGHLAEFKRCEQRLQRSVSQLKICKLSGAVGTYSAITEEIEQEVASQLGLTVETVATQVVPRDRHGEVITSLGLLASALERLSVELRHLQRTEVGEVFEGFRPGQKGSSAMPHKKNPISSENITGLARLLRSYVVPALENVALWHERDISHSSVERVIFPDAFILADYALHRATELIENLVVDEDRMLSNMNLSAGQLFSSHLLLALVESGLSREDSYALVQKLSHSLSQGQDLLSACQGDAQVQQRLSAETLTAIFSGDKHRGAVKQRTATVLKELSGN